MMDLWYGLSVAVQDAIVAVLLLAPAVLIGAFVSFGYRPWPLVSAMLWRYRWINLIFVLLIAVAIGMGIALTAQERGLRVGSAHAAEKFDLIVAAPGSEMTMMMASVFLEPSDVPLLSGETFNSIAQNPRVEFAAPLAFGDSFKGHPIVGTTSQFLTHLADNGLNGDIFKASMQAVVGVDVPLSIGANFKPAHGFGSFINRHAHEDEIQVVGQMNRTGTPWDKAIVVPIETVWDVHGIANGHEEQGPDANIGAPFDAHLFPGTPAIVVKANSLAATYALKSEFTRDGETMAFFPGAVLANLYRVVGDVRRGISTIIAVSQVLVAISVLSALFILSRLFQRNLAVLRAIGAPPRFITGVVWNYAACLIFTGALIGVGLGVGMAEVVAGIVSEQTDMAVPIHIGWSEIHPVLGFASIASTLSLVPALLNIRGNIVSALRS